MPIGGEVAMVEDKEKSSDFPKSALLDDATCLYLDAELSSLDSRSYQPSERLPQAGELVGPGDFVSMERLDSDGAVVEREDVFLIDLWQNEGGTFDFVFEPADQGDGWSPGFVFQLGRTAPIEARPEGESWRRRFRKLTVPQDRPVTLEWRRGVLEDPEAAYRELDRRFVAAEIDIAEYRQRSRDVVAVLSWRLRQARQVSLPLTVRAFPSAVGEECSWIVYGGTDQAQRIATDLYMLGVSRVDVIDASGYLISSSYDSTPPAQGRIETEDDSTYLVLNVGGESWQVAQLAGESKSRREAVALTILKALGRPGAQELARIIREGARADPDPNRGL